VTTTSLDLDRELIDRAKSLIGVASDREVINLALRRLVAAKQKRSMVEGIKTLHALPEGLGAPTRSYPIPEP
jgi:Arc/MetJ family transcription regulator